MGAVCHVASGSCKALECVNSETERCPVATQAPTVTSIEIVPVQPDPADRKILAFQRAHTARPLEHVAYVVKIFLAEVLPPTGAGFALYLGQTPIPRYSGFDGGIYFTVHDPRFLIEYDRTTVYFKYNN
jgi:hypothetical protein